MQPIHHLILPHSCSNSIIPHMDISMGMDMGIAIVIHKALLALSLPNHAWMYVGSQRHSQLSYSPLSSSSNNNNNHTQVALAEINSQQPLLVCHILVAILHLLLLLLMQVDRVTLRRKASLPLAPLHLLPLCQCHRHLARHRLVLLHRHLPCRDKFPTHQTHPPQEVQRLIIMLVTV